MSIGVSHIKKSYGRREVLHDLSFRIEKGEIASFLGPNGAGKSTCMKIITGGLAADAGEVYIGDFNIRTHPLEAKRLMGYLPENNPLYPEMYVREYLEYVARLYALPDVHNTVARQIDWLNLSDVAGKAIGTLSKGYRQRVGLAQALIHDPEVLILDEPFSGLDPNQLEEVHELIKELSAGKAILFSSHSLKEVSELGGRVLILNRGKLVADTSLTELTRTKNLEEAFKELTDENNR